MVLGRKYRKRQTHALSIIPPKGMAEERVLSGFPVEATQRLRKGWCWLEAAGNNGLGVFR